MLYRELTAEKARGYVMYINEGHRQTQVWVEETFECDLCDQKAPAVLLNVPSPFSNMLICGECLAKLAALLEEVCSTVN